MSTILGSLRRLAFAPSLAEVGFAGRGFSITPTDATRRLETVPQAVVCGFEWGIDTRSLWELERRLAMVEPDLRGFAYEGATMAFTILDAMGFRRGHRTRDLLRSSGEPHLLLAYIGVGFAMSKLPRVLWKKIMPDLTGLKYFPIMTWLAVDGYGFDLAYFHPTKWVDRQEIPAPYPWEGNPDYFLRAVDQGIGRALWFMNGGRPEPVVAAVGRFAPHRRADLWSGIGLAATFAGGCSPDELAWLRQAAGRYRPEVALGAVNAVVGRDHAGYLPERTEPALAALTGLTVAAAVNLAASTEVPGERDGKVPAYELWRQRVAAAFRPGASTDLAAS